MTPDAPAVDVRRRLLGPTLFHSAARLVVVVAAILTGLMLSLGVGMWRNDAAIDAHPVRATGTVLSVSALRTGVEYVDNEGVSQRPPAGILYPGDLIVGQQFLIEYDAEHPSLARVAGRSAADGLVMLLIVVVTSWAIAVPAFWLLRRRGRGQGVRQARRHDAAIAAVLGGRAEGSKTDGRPVPAESPVPQQTTTGEPASQ
ncbi:DUF3592 domain-containing protein [Nakamurella antarctica]|uniref:DUF3592 domain-containing protein n=1 Tax=Nakamurella antarctica TaxID=1902245 RepID=A0A3G8ZXK2_9ACTN|nr:DUF3592 domain-containing protein [Nakamurella antarctica]AZI58746.1 DUF3592 domain-containing protein [Nakamurella antarctica]